MHTILEPLSMHKRTNITLLLSLSLAINLTTSQYIFATSTSQPTTINASNSLDAQMRRCNDLFRLERWTDARVELLQARKTKGLSATEREQIDYMLTVCAVELNLKSKSSRIYSFSVDYPLAALNHNLNFSQSIISSEEGDLESAFQKIQNVNPKHLTPQKQDEYNIRRGYLAFTQKDYPQAKEFLAKIKKESDYYPHALYFNSYMAYSEGDYDLAKSGFESLMKDESYSKIIPFYLLQVAFKTGDYQEAISFGKELLENTTAESRMGLLRTLAESHFRIKEYDIAYDYIEQYREAGGKIAREENYLAGFSLHELGRYHESIERLKLASGADDALTQNAAFHLANCYIRTNNKEGALKAFSLASNDHFNKEIAEEALFNYAKLQYELGSGVLDQTINLLTRYIDTYDNPEREQVIQSILVAAYYNSRDYDTAYDKIGQIKSPDSDIRAAKQKIAYLRGLECFMDGNYREAKSLLQESLEIGITAKQVALAKFWIAEIEYLEGSYSSAVINYNYYLARAPKEDKTAVEAQYSLGYALLKLGRESEAKGHLQQYINSKLSTPELRVDAYNRIGDIEYVNRQYIDALKSYRQAILFSGKSANYARFQIAMIRGLQGNNKEKSKLLREIISAGGTVDYALYELGLTYIKMGEYQESITTLKKMMSEYPNSKFFAQAISNIAVAYINLDDAENALKYYNYAIETAPQSQVAKDAMQGVREIYVSQGDAEGYFEYAKSMGMEGDLSAVARDSLSFASARELYFASSDSEPKRKSATKALDAYISNYPKGYYKSDALFFLSDAYLKSGDQTRAIETLSKLANRDDKHYSERVYNMLSKLCYDQGDYVKSAAAYRKLYEVSEGAEERQAAILGYAKSAINSKSASEIEVMSSDILALGEKSTGVEATLIAKAARATILRERGERKEALVLYQDVAKRSKDVKAVSEARYYIIDDAYRTGDRDKAEKMIFDFSKSELTDRYWLAKSFILLGDIYLARDDAFQARATYQSVVDGYSATDDGILDEAKKKISEIQ